jgi:UDP-N-acetylglucosamine 2-epimerase
VKKIRVTTILGTRPELIRLSMIIEQLDLVFEHRLVHTGQNSDVNLSKVFFQEMKIRKPDLYLEIPNSSPGIFIGNLFPEIEIEIEKYPPDAVVVLGDTNSALAGFMAKRKGIPVYHLEAGNRSYDQNIPEEINRRMIDHFADFNLTYTDNAKDNLLREGIHPRNIAVIGSPLCEVISKFKNDINSSNILSRLKIEAEKYFLVSIHRQENVDDPLRLKEIMQSLNTVALKFGLPVVISTHPRTQKRLDMLRLENNSLLSFHEPFGFIDFCKLQKSSKLVISDSGSISEESVILGFKAITIRDSMERQEALESGSIILSGTIMPSVINSINVAEAMPISKFPPREYLISDTSTRVINLIMSTVNQHGFWSGIRKK